MRKCESAQQGAAACLGLITGRGGEQAEAADGVAPMDVVVDEGAVVAGKSNGGGVGAGGSEGTAVNGSISVEGNEGGAPGKGKLRAATADGNGR